MAGLEQGKRYGKPNCDPQDGSQRDCQALAKPETMHKPFRKWQEHVGSQQRYQNKI